MWLPPNSLYYGSIWMLCWKCFKVHLCSVYSALCSWLHHVCCGCGDAMFCQSTEYLAGLVKCELCFLSGLALLLLNQSDSNLRWSFYCGEILHPLLLQTPYQSYCVAVCVCGQMHTEIESLCEARQKSGGFVAFLPPNMLLHRRMWLLPVLWAQFFSKGFA